MRVKIDMDLIKLAQLVHSGALCIADLQALDSESKNALWRLCLQCAKHACSTECCADCQAKPHQAHYYQPRHETTH